MTNTHDPRLGEMGIPLACGGPLCGIDHHHPLCKFTAAPAAPVAAQVQPDSRTPADTLVNGGALILALNALRRAGKNEIADELEKTVSLLQQPVSGADRKLIAQLCEALDLARTCHGVMLMSDPPQEMWKSRSVDQVISDALEAAKAQLSGNSGQLEEWLNKTEFVQEWINTRKLSARYLGWHRADVMRDLLEKQDADKVDAALAEMVHAMFRSANSIPVTRITIDRKQYDAAIDAARKEQA
ncbi:hypothetical protein [Alcaligenes faecalis]|uniref:hypothetical protein n=1 Tax=Alcaligenes faecalis TaxID=511 RepID=UPI0029338935|nr:hypothetical protein [Alcaligenes faecalis]MDV2116448.1 hypothetical protein [Alcaligenes faecalis]